MRERPVNFADHEVRAVLDGRKTQFRRPVKGTWQGLPLDTPAYRSEALAKCPLGAPGDRLWVREAWTPRSYGTFGVWTLAGKIVEINAPAAPTVPGGRRLGWCGACAGCTCGVSDCVDPCTCPTAPKVRPGGPRVVGDRTPHVFTEPPHGTGLTCDDCGAPRWCAAAPPVAAALDAQAAEDVRAVERVLHDLVAQADDDLREVEPGFYTTEALRRTRARGERKKAAAAALRRVLARVPGVGSSGAPQEPATVLRQFEEAVLECARVGRPTRKYAEAKVAALWAMREAPGVDRSDVEAVLHELQHGAASEGDVAAIGWCARTLAAALGANQ